VAALCALFAPTACAQRASDQVERHVRDAYEAAWQRLPSPWRAQLRDVRLHRVASLGAPADAPLSLRLLDRGAFAFFTNVERRICVTDAGARLAPSWGQAPPTREQMAAFLLDEVGYEVPGERAQQIDEAWRRFVVTVYAWRGEPAPTPLPAVGAVEVLDRFLVDGVRRSLGGDVPLEQMLFHELAHAVQNHLRRMEPHMTMWGSLSGWRERDGDKPADGYSSGRFAIERPVVLIRLLLGLPRGDSLYVPHERARFVDTYARYDLREDFAECARLMAYDPQRLAEAAPMKFLYLGSLGWSAKLDPKTPGPMWLGRDTMEVDAFRRATVAGARALLSERPDDVQPHPLAVAALLRAHRPMLKKADLPPAHGNRQVPPDLPPDLLQYLGGGRLTFVVEGEARQLPRQRLIALVDDELRRWIELQEMAVELEELLGSSAEELVDRYEKDVQGAPNDHERQLRFDRMVPALRRELPEMRFRQLCYQERTYWGDRRPLITRPAFPTKGTGRSELVARRYDLLRASKEDYPEALTVPDASHASVELASVYARLLFEARERKRAVEAIAQVPGRTWGAYRRVELYMLVDERAAAIAAADEVPLPGLRDLLLGKVADWLQQQGDTEQRERVLDLRRRRDAR